MGTAETGWFRLEGGTVCEMDLPLAEGIAQRVKRGEITHVVDVDGKWIAFEEEGTPVAAPNEELTKATSRIAELETELDAVHAAFADAGVEHPHGADGVADLAAMAAGRLEDLKAAVKRAEDAEAKLAETEKALAKAKATKPKAE